MSASTESRSRRRPTPCVGICSTTYGDLVCRGCKRFAHEIVEWNGYDEEQREQIRDRLDGLRDQVVAQYLAVGDASAWDAYSVVIFGQSQAPTSERVYHTLGQLVARNQDLSEAGLTGVRDGSSAEDADEGIDALGALKQIDREVYSRSLAHYERNFKVTA